MSLRAAGAYEKGQMNIETKAGFIFGFKIDGYLQRIICIPIVVGIYLLPYTTPVRWEVREEIWQILTILNVKIYPAL